ncbi:hypothetical protein HPP92_026892 [Vanilla planifolia]|uniref:Uncharacterized protein n=1 Tax=Vanilla planifolia TaxID=51239 RepID=A0A835PCR3_VANPL|nr:hypothetical protein HPP92_026892 [Vanilla planifolia]
MERYQYHTRGGGGTGVKSTRRAPARVGQDLLFGWGNRRRLRCVKVPRREPSVADAKALPVPVDRRAGRTDKEPTVAAAFCRIPLSNPRALSFRRDVEAERKCVTRVGELTVNGNSRDIYVNMVGSGTRAVMSANHGLIQLIG